MKSNLAKIIPLTLTTLLLVVSLTACGDKVDQESTSLPEIDLDLPTSSTAVDNVYNPDGTQNTEPVDTDPSSETEPSTESSTEDGSGDAPSERKLAMTTNQVNMRKSANGDVLTVLPKGALVTVNDTSDSEWYQVSFGDQDGFVSSQYLDMNTTSAEMNLQATVTAKTLNVRSTASSDGSVLGVLSEGSRVTVIDSENGWYKIQYNGSTGFVSASYLAFAE